MWETNLNLVSGFGHKIIFMVLDKIFKLRIFNSFMSDVIVDVGDVIAVGPLFDDIIRSTQFPSPQLTVANVETYLDQTPHDNDTELSKSDSN